MKIVITGQTFLSNYKLSWFLNNRVCMNCSSLEYKLKLKFEISRNF
jgi:hypothetical protein